MGRPTIEEAKKKHLSELNKERIRRYRASHTFKTIHAEISVERYNEFTKMLEVEGMTQKQFIEDAIDEFLKKTRN